MGRYLPVLALGALFTTGCGESLTQRSAETPFESPYIHEGCLRIQEGGSVVFDNIRDMYEVFRGSVESRGLDNPEIEDVYINAEATLERFREAVARCRSGADFRIADGILGSALNQMGAAYLAQDAVEWERANR